MPRSRTALALMAGDALTDLLQAETQGLVGDPQGRARTRASRAIRGSSGSLKKLSALRRRLPSLSLGRRLLPGSRKRRGGDSAAPVRSFPGRRRRLAAVADPAMRVRELP